MFETDDDRRAYLEAFGVCVRIRGQPLQAIFDNDYLSVGTDGVDVESRAPVLTCAASDVELLDIHKGDQVEGLPLPYEVVRHEPDGTGMSRLILIE